MSAVTILRSTFVVSCLGLLPAAPSLAQDVDTPATSAAAPRSEGNRGNMGNSESARSRRTAGAEIGYGLIAGVLPGVAFNGYWQALPSLQVGLLYNSVSVDLKDAVDDTATVKVKEAGFDVTFVAAHARWFPGNSFYVDAGLGTRKVSASFDIVSSSIDYGLVGDIKADTTTLLVSIGNQWQWDSGFTLGVEWLGYSSALSGESSGDLREKGTAAASAPTSTKADLEKLRKDSKDLAETLGTAGVPRLLTLSVGWAF